MIDAPLAVAFAAGLVAAVNPCGFAMLPAYVGYFLGREGDRAPSRGASVLRAVPVALAVSAGFVVVFVLAGTLLRSVSSTILEYAPWATLVIGLGLLVLGVATLAGFELTARIPKLERGGRSRGLWSMFVYGISYAVASLTCSLGVFLSVIVGAFSRTDFVSGVAVMVAYAAGMSLVITALTVAIALARDSVVGFLRSGMCHATRIAGGIMVVMGAYVAWYGVYSLRVRRDPLTAGGPVELVEEWQQRAEQLVHDTGGARLGLILAVAIVAMVCVGVLVSTLRRSPTGEDPADDPAPDAAVDGRRTDEQVAH